MAEERSLLLHGFLDILKLTVPLLQPPPAVELQTRENWYTDFDRPIGISLLRVSLN